MYDLHVHSVFSDGELIPSEIARRYSAKGFEAIAITDHADSSNMEFILKNLTRNKKDFNGHGVKVLVGIELTHLPPELIPPMASKAKKMGAEIVVVHGESLVEPIARGTNRAGVSTPEVDILSHPGLITIEEAELARNNNIFLEISARKGHSLTNGHVARVAMETDAQLLANTDSHSPEDIISPKELYNVILGAGLGQEDSKIITGVNPKRFIVE